MHLRDDRIEESKTCKYQLQQCMRGSWLTTKYAVFVGRLDAWKDLYHDNTSDPPRTLGAGGAALIVVVAGVAAIWKSVDALFL